MGTVELVVGILLISMVYGVGVSLIAPFFPGMADNQMVIFTDGHGIQQIGTMKDTMGVSMQNQTQIPFTEFGSLIFFSSLGAFGLFMNILTAIPQMLGILVNGLLMIIPLPSYFQGIISIGFIGICTLLFWLALFLYVISARSPTYGGIK